MIDVPSSIIHGYPSVEEVRQRVELAAHLPFDIHPELRDFQEQLSTDPQRVGSRIRKLSFLQKCGQLHEELQGLLMSIGVRTQMAVSADHPEHDHTHLLVLPEDPTTIVPSNAQILIDAAGPQFYYNLFHIQVGTRDSFRYHLANTGEAGEWALRHPYDSMPVEELFRLLYGRSSIDLDHPSIRYLMRTPVLIV